MASAVRRSRAVATRLLQYHHASSPSCHHVLPAASLVTNTAPPQLNGQHLKGSPVLPGQTLGRSRGVGLWLMGGGDGRESGDSVSRKSGRLSHGGRAVGRCWKPYGCSSTRSSTSSASSKSSETDGEEIARQMIGYAASNRINVATQVEVSRVLEQGYNFLLSQGPSTANAAAKVLLTLATLHVDRGKLLDAVDVLQQVANLEGISAEVRVSTCQALVGVFLRIHKDSDALSEARLIVELINDAEGLPLELTEELKFRAAATVQFAEHATGSKISGNLQDISGLSSWLDHKEANLDGVAAALLGIAECAHVRGHFSQAKDYYEKASTLAKNCSKRELFGSGAGAMVAEEVLVGAGAGLGQVAAHLGDFDDAEKELTTALKYAEQINGDKHPRVGVVLACLADVYAQRGALKGDLFLAEGLYRKAIDLLGAPPLDIPSARQNVDLSDVIAISRARYAAILSKTSNRESEAEKLKTWATAAWKGPCSLSNVLTQEASMQPTANTTESEEAVGDAYTGRYVVIDARLGRVLYSPSNI